VLLTRKKVKKSKLILLTLAFAVGILSCLVSCLGSGEQRSRLDDRLIDIPVRNLKATDLKLQFFNLMLKPCLHKILLVDFFVQLILLFLHVLCLITKLAEVVNQIFVFSCASFYAFFRFSVVFLR